MRIPKEIKAIADRYIEEQIKRLGAITPLLLPSLAPQPIPVRVKRSRKRT